MYRISSIAYVHGFDHGYILKNNCNGTEKNYSGRGRNQIL